MKLIRYEYKDDTFIGVLEDEKIYSLDNKLDKKDDMLELIQKYPNISDLKINKDHHINLDEVKLLVPLNRTENDILCVGLNYHDHIEETKEVFKAVDDATYFSKRAIEITGPDQDIFLDPEVDSEMDYETELGVIIGKGGKNIPLEKAYDHVFGYTVFNDYSARALQRKHNQYFKGKSLDGYTAIGPYILTADEISLPIELDLKTRINGELRQDSNTKYMIRDVADLISELSAGMTLVAGDVIATGTPKGVGMGFKPGKFLKKGDTVESEIQGLGILKNKIV